jgi:hypothetical protein
MQKTEDAGDHEKFKELCALAQADALSHAERLELMAHLETCEDCRQLFDQYSMIGEAGMEFLAGDFVPSQEAARWDSRQASQRLSDAIEREKTQKVVPIRSTRADHPKRTAIWAGASRYAAAAAAAGLIVAIAFGSYRAGESKGAASAALPSAASPRLVAPSAPTGAAPAPAQEAQLAEVARLERLLSDQKTEVDRLSAALKQSEQHETELAAGNEKKDDDLRQLMSDRDKLAVQLASSQDANKAIQASLAGLRAERDEAVSRAGAMETKVADLTVAAQDQGKRLKDDEQYLTSDRDIRELMGARKLYIADVFDVDSVSRTRKPFGRVFYTESKSLVFYAFDLDHQPGAKNASTFQVWGKKDSELNAESHPMNLGILYEDSESNRRWVLRTDDSKQLSEIDAVFVTVEPHGGSQKPTGKPFLYALLRKEANHP